MSCCAPGVEAAAELNGGKTPEQDDETLLAASRDLPAGTCQLDLAVPDVHCAACINNVETALEKLDMVETARVNLSARRVRITYKKGAGRPSSLTEAIVRSGYRPFLLDPMSEAETDKTYKSLVRALAVAGFAAGNIMLFSVSIWSGADEVTRNLFHWISALIAIPAVAFAGQPFFRSAWRAVRHGALNMDVPISLAVLLALALSVFETLNHGEHAYFDASISLLFFLLIGRTLDHLMREKARGAVRNLARLAPKSATRLNDDGSIEQVAISEITPGMTLLLGAGERVPVDAEVVAGISEVDLALVTGESVPERAETGTRLLAGATNLSASLTLKAQKPATESFLARMIELMEAAEGSKAGYKRIADRAAAIYAPAVHVLALATFLGWGLLAGDWHQATVNAIAVLIITCPCALALAVPIVHVVAAGRLFEAGVMMRDGAALERLATISRVVFDKTGTLTRGAPELVTNLPDPDSLAHAAALAAGSSHPFSKAIAAAAGPLALTATARTEEPGAGISAIIDGETWKLGRADWCLSTPPAAVDDTSEVWLARNGEPVARFGFADPARADAAQTIADLKGENFTITLLSGDRPGPVAALATELGIGDARARLTPAGKLDALDEMAKAGEKTLMVGDGINDAPALRAAHVSMAPATAADIGRAAADFIFTRDTLQVVPGAIRLARAAASAVKQNFGLAIAYNIVAVPLAVSGHVTPLIAALAMSSSSILVTVNALALRLKKTGLPKQAPATAPHTAPQPKAEPAPGQLAAAE